MKPYRRRRAGREAFTLMEVLLVLAILVVLGAAAVFAFKDTLFAANKDLAKSQVGALKLPINMFLKDFNRYPDNLNELWDPQEGGQAQYVEEEIPLDPWGNPYQFKTPGDRNPNSYDVWSAGPDGQDGSGDDIGNWKRDGE